MRKPNEIDLIFDFDGVICQNNSGSYADAEPIPYSIEQINRAYNKGFNIIIFTARYGKRHPGNQYQEGYEEALKWLRDNNVKFHSLRMGKPAGDLYVDDKACLISKNEDWAINFWPKVHDLKNKDKYNQPIPKSASSILIKTSTDSLEKENDTQYSKWVLRIFIFIVVLGLIKEILF